MQYHTGFCHITTWVSHNGHSALNSREFRHELWKGSCTPLSPLNSLYKWHSQCPEKLSNALQPKDQQAFTVKDQIVNILGFVGLMVSATPTQLSHCSVKGNMVGPPYSWMPHPRIQPITDLKYSQTKKFQKVPKSKTWIYCTLEIIYIAFTAIYISFTLY